MKSFLCFIKVLETQNLWLVWSAFLGDKVFAHEVFKDIFSYIQIILVLKIMTYLIFQIAYGSFYIYFGYTDSQIGKFMLLAKILNCQKL